MLKVSIGAKTAQKRPQPHRPRRPLPIHKTRQIISTPRAYPQGLDATDNSTYKVSVAVSLLKKGYTQEHAAKSSTCYVCGVLEQTGKFFFLYQFCSDTDSVPRTTDETLQATAPVSLTGKFSKPHPSTGNGDVASQPVPSELVLG